MSSKDAAALAPGGRTLRASDLVRANSSASSEERGGNGGTMMLRKRSTSTGLGSSLLQGFGGGPPQSPASSEDAMFKGHLPGIPLPSTCFPFSLPLNSAICLGLPIDPSL